MQTKVNTVPTVTVNGKEVLDFMPTSESLAAIVPLNTIQRLADLLSLGSIDTITRQLKERLDMYKNIEDYTKLLQDELDFHHTVNLLTMYEKEPHRETSNAVAAKGLY